MTDDPIRALVDELAAPLSPSERIKLLEAEIRLRARWGGMGLASVEAMHVRHRPEQADSE